MSTNSFHGHVRYYPDQHDPTQVEVYYGSTLWPSFSVWVPPGSLDLTGTPRRRVGPLDTLDVGPCPSCGSSGFIVDVEYASAPTGWLLCLDSRRVGCVQCLDLPDDVEFVPEE